MSKASKPVLRRDPKARVPDKMIDACRKGRIEELRKHIAAGASINGRDKYDAPQSKRPLTTAAAAGQLAIVKLLLDLGADINLESLDGERALTHAAAAGHLHVVKLLLDRGADIDLPGGLGGLGYGPAVVKAACKDHLPIVKELVRRGTSKKSLTDALFHAIGEEHHAILDYLLASGTVADESALDIASSDAKLVKRLLAAGAKPTPENLSRAVGWGCEDTAVEFVRAGADLWPKEHMPFPPVLHNAVRKGFTKVLKAIIEREVDLNRRVDINILEPPPGHPPGSGKARKQKPSEPEPREARQTTPLIVAVRSNNKEMVQLLLDGRAKAEATDGDGMTPMAWALKLGRSEIIPLLQRKGARAPAQPEGSPRFALMSAAQAGDLAGVRKALAAGGDPTELHPPEVPTGFGQESVTVLMRAAEAGHLAIVDELLKAGANPNQVGLSGDVIGMTALMFAARKGHVDVVERLLKAGADPRAQQVALSALWESAPMQKRWHNAGDNLAAKYTALLKFSRYRDDSALHEAALAGHYKVVKVLLEAGADPNLRSTYSGTVFEAAAEGGNRRTIETLKLAKSQSAAKRR